MDLEHDDVLAADLFDDPLTGAVVQRIRAMEPGERLPSERELAVQLGVSRTALRDRLSYLESMGVLERRTGAGTFIRGLRSEAVSEALILGLTASGMTLSSLTSMRVALERQAACEAAQVGDPVKIAHMAVAVLRMERTDDPAELYAADVAFHQALFVASCSPALEFFADALSGVLSRSVRQRQHRIFHLTHDKQRIRVLHRAIYEAVVDGDPTRSMRAVDEHFHYLDELQEDVTLSRTT